MKEKQLTLFGKMVESELFYDFELYEIENGKVKGYNDFNPSHQWIKKHIGKFDKLCVEFVATNSKEVKNILEILDTYNGTFCGLSVEVESWDDMEYYSIYADFSNLSDSLINGE